MRELLISAFVLVVSLVPVSEARALILRNCADEADPPYDIVCPAVDIDGHVDDVYEPGTTPSSFRGVGDPSMRKDPLHDEIYMTYTYPFINTPGGTLIMGTKINYATSEDGGDTWDLVGTLWDPVSDVITVHYEVSESTEEFPGYWNSEVSNVVPIPFWGSTYWIGARLAWFLDVDNTYENIASSSWRLLISKSTANNFASLSTAASQSLVGSLAPESADPENDVWIEWPSFDVNLSALDEDVGHCDFWGEPALRWESPWLYLVLRCFAYDLVGEENVWDSEGSSLYVFRTDDVAQSVTNWSWSYVGKLAGQDEADELTPNTEGEKNFNQVDIFEDSTGDLLAVVTPVVHDDQYNSEIHLGCQIVEIDPLATPGFSRNFLGFLKVRVGLGDTTDGGPNALPTGPGGCTYDPDSSTGVLSIQRIITPTTFEVHLRKTDIDP
ncbi:MAG: hypothetical protein H6923_06275 [Alphaproteobacteria bacterium]|nr:hypothetical protein [Alphaproteobacteria bacterium]